LRSKLALELSIGDGEMVVAGDTYNVVFRGEDGQPLRIPFAVYEALPKEHLVANLMVGSSNLTGRTILSIICERSCAVLRWHCP
jgi:hypothetical protein